MMIAALIIICYSIILTMAPAVRFHGDSTNYRFGYWIGTLVWFLSFTLLHHQTSRKLPHRDPFILPVVALLSGIGLMTIWRLYPVFGQRQSLWLVISSLLVWLGIKYPAFLDYLRSYKYIWLILGLLLTGLTIFMGTNPSGGGSTRWLQIFGMHFQPSEPLKLILVVYLASFFSDHLSVVEGKLKSLLPTIFVIGVALLMLIFQRDLGTASIFLLIYLALVFTSQGNKMVLWITPVLILLAGVVGYFFIDVVKLRVDTWLNPFGDPVGTSYQIIQSMIAIASGGLIGAGPGLGSPSLIPVAVSDFIFAAIAEELGFLGALMVVLLIVFLIYRAINIAISTRKTFHRNLILGLLFYIGIQSIMILGGNINLLPLTGVTLPFVSYGGSSLVVSFIVILLMVMISHQTTSENKIPKTSHPRFIFISGLMIPSLIIVSIVTSLFSFWFAPSLIGRPENPRWIIHDRFVKRGDILDRNSQVIITSFGEIGNLRRTSQHTPLTPVVGYTSGIYGQTGIEASMFPYLRGHEGYPYLTLFWNRLLYNQPPQGLNVRLTVDLNLQKVSDELLSGTPGAVILMNANSGEILAMSSYPYFDAANLEEEWNTLITRPDSPLLNRATQGLYLPGAALFPFILSRDIEIVEQYPKPEMLWPNIGSDPQCAVQPTEALTWQALISNGCIEGQASLANTMDMDEILALYEDVGFFTQPMLQLATIEPVSKNEVDQEELVYGTGVFRVSPLQMAIAASALTNQGILPSPRIVNAYQDPNNQWIVLPKLSAARLTNIPPQSAIDTISLLKVNNSSYWQVTAIPEQNEESVVTWVIGGTTGDWRGQPLVLVVVIEDDLPNKAQEISKTLIEQALFTEVD